MATTETPNNGGAAPPQSQCRYTLASGSQCRRWAVRGREHCPEHARWLAIRGTGPVEIPLIEDPASIALVLSQTARALACGQIPPANGRAIISACRVAQAALTHTLAEAKFRLKLRQLGIPASDFFPGAATPPQPSAPPSVQPATESTIQPETGPTPSAEATLHADPSPDPPALSSEPPRLPSPCDPCIAALRDGADPASIDCPNCPVANGRSLESPLHPAPHDDPNAARCTPHAERSPEPRALRSQPRFRDLKKHWDQALHRTESALLDMYFKRPDETQEEFLAARARPFDEPLTANR